MLKDIKAILIPAAIITVAVIIIVEGFGPVADLKDKAVAKVRSMTGGV